MASEEDDTPILAQQPANFDIMSIDELEDYIAQLTQEISKTERLIKKKQQAGNTAENIFKS